MYTLALRNFFPVIKYFRSFLPFLFSSFFLFLSSSAIAQEIPQITELGEELHDLQLNPKLFKASRKPPASFLKNSTNWIYTIDTLSLPFIDDFSANRLKNFNVDSGDANVNVINKIAFDVNGSFVDSLEAMLDTSWYYQFNPSTLLYDSFANAPLIITFFGNNNIDSASALTLPTGTDTVWSNITYRFNASDTDTVILTRDTVFHNSRDTFYFVADNSFSLWLDSSAFINDGFALNPPTIGVATFDGLNAAGEAYDFNIAASQGLADKLTSKPIDLSGLLPDSTVIFSFYYQPKGMGDYPDPEDSLVLEFYSTADSLWYWVWSSPGITTAQSYQPQSFQYVKIPLADSKFLTKGFQFRFRNYATLTGMLDIWNIDYVYLDNNRSWADAAVNDLGFMSRQNSFISQYTSMPMKAFKGNADQYMVQNFQTQLKNFSNNTVNTDSNRYYVYDEYESGPAFFTSANVASSFAPLSQQTVNQPVNAAPNNFKFTPSDSDRTVFKIKFVSGQSQIDLLPYNDTMTFYQVFDSYYAYDDGTAEGIYSLGNKPGVELACKFQTVVDDSLKGLYLYFPYMLNDVSTFTFQPLIWNDANGVPGSIVYQGNMTNPDYSSSINEFVRYKIDPPVVIGGTFYVGWRQSTGDKIYLGFDKNTDSQNKIFHTLAQNNAWSNTAFKGSLMMRPDFGDGEPVKRLDNSGGKKAAVHIYPNPAKDYIYIGSTTDEIKSVEVKIYNTLGQEIYRNTIYDVESSVDISSIQNGIYFMKVGNASMEKIIIAR